MAKTRFSFSRADLRDLAEAALKRAARNGASAAETEVSEGYGISVGVRRGEIDTIEHNRDKGIGVTVYVGQRKGFASTSDFSPRALRDTVDAALAIARFTAEDACAGLPDVERLSSKRRARGLELYHPWALSVDAAVEQARAMEAAAFAVSPQVSNSEGATISSHASQFYSANSSGFRGGYRTTRHSLGCSVIAGEGAGMQRDHWYVTARCADDLAAPVTVGDYAARRALSRLGSRRRKTVSVPVLFEAPVACALIGNFVYAASGGALYRRSSFLADALGTPVFADHLSIHEDPAIPRGLASSPFDGEGVATAARELVSGGVLNGYFLSSYTARKLGMRTTGNAGGSHNLIVRGHTDTLPGLLARMRRGLLVTELLGHGVNYVTGDYSRGAAGFWVENGEIAYPVDEITIAGNLRDMFRGIVAVGDDVVVRGSKQCGSLLVDRMTVAGA